MPSPRACLWGCFWDRQRLPSLSYAQGVPGTGSGLLAYLGPSSRRGPPWAPTRLLLHLDPSSGSPPLNPSWTPTPCLSSALSGPPNCQAPSASPATSPPPFLPTPSYSHMTSGPLPALQGLVLPHSLASTQAVLSAQPTPALLPTCFPRRGVSFLPSQAPAPQRNAPTAPLSQHSGSLAACGDAVGGDTGGGWVRKWGRGGQERAPGGRGVRRRGGRDTPGRAGAGGRPGLRRDDGGGRR